MVEKATTHTNHSFQCGGMGTCITIVDENGNGNGDVRDSVWMDLPNNT